MKKRHYILLAIVAVGLLVCAAVALRPRQLPLEECSQLYRDYAHNPHVTVAFIKDFPVNDTLRVDVTTLQATDSTGWHSLMLYFGYTEEMIDNYYESVKRITSICEIHCGQKRLQQKTSSERCKQPSGYRFIQRPNLQHLPYRQY